jgi:diaminopimelate epimerase
MNIKFTKMHGIGNDFIIIDDRKLHIADKIEYGTLAKKICKRRFSVGADGIIIIQNSEKCDIKFIIVNSDGSFAEMCGNGMRCFAKYIYDKKIIEKKSFKVETFAGEIIPKICEKDINDIEKVTVDMGAPVLEPSKIPFISNNNNIIQNILTVKGEFKITAVSMGNPHAVIFTDKITDNMINETGPLIEKNESFPKKTNVEFVQILSDEEFNMRVWERGVGETLACGTGACAALVAAHLNNKTKEKALIHLKGGDLFIEWDKNNNHIYKTGDAEYMYEGFVTIGKYK